MKAVIVIDLDGDISCYHADIYKEDDKGNGEIVKSYCPLKSLPEKKPIDKTLNFDGYDNVVQSALARGYNAYHDEIIGEE